MNPLQAQQLAPLSIDLTRLHRRTVTSFYSNLVTRPTGRAVRMGVEQQLGEWKGAGGPCLSILDFSQVRVMDYSCADEIVAKLLLRYVEGTMSPQVYFLARGLQDHHVESVLAVLDRHGLLLAVEGATGDAELLGPATDHERACWSALMARGRATEMDLSGDTGIPGNLVAAILRRFLAVRVLVGLPGGGVCAVPWLSRV